MTEGPQIRPIDSFKRVAGKQVPDMARLLEIARQWFTANYIQPVHLFDDDERELGIVSTRDRRTTETQSTASAIPGAATSVNIDYTVPTGKRWDLENAWSLNSTSTGTREMIIRKDSVNNYFLIGASVAAGTPSIFNQKSLPVDAGDVVRFTIRGVALDTVSAAIFYREEDA